MRRAAAAVLAAFSLGLGGCSASEGTQGGGRIVGETVTVYSLMPLSGPRAGVARDVVAGQKLALREAGGKAGSLKVNFVSLDLGPDAEPERISLQARRAMHDPQVIAVISDLDSATARTTVPLFNAAGLLHVSPGATYAGFVAPGAPGEPDRWRPSGRESFASVAPTDAAQAVAIAAAVRGGVTIEAGAEEDSLALADAVRARVRGAKPRGSGETTVYAGTDPDDALGVIESILENRPKSRILLPEALLRAEDPVRKFANRRQVKFLSSAPAGGPEFEGAFLAAFKRPPATRYARVGYDAMKGVLAALRAAGDRAGDRQAVIDAYFEDDPLGRAAQQPFSLVSG